MSEGKDIFHWVCAQPCELEAVASLDLEDFRKLGGYLSRKGEINGVPGRIWGMCLVDGFKRVMKDK